MSERRRLLVVPAVALLLLLPVPAGAQDAPGEGLLSYRLVANAPGIALNGLYRDVDVTVPEVTSSLTTGGVGAGLASLAWPGPVAGNAGSTILVLAPQAPPETVLLNSPVRAETRSGGTRRATNTTVPGTLMTSAADPDEVTAQASTGESTVLPIASSGVLASSSRVALTGPTSAVATAESSVERLSLVDGMIEIGAVRSNVEATTDGLEATAEGATTVTGMTVAGVPVTVDANGLRLADQSVPLPLPQEQLNSAVEALGLQVLLTPPRTESNGGAVRYDSGALVLLYEQDGMSYALTIGRASVQVEASRGTAFEEEPVAAEPVAPAAPVLVDVAPPVEPLPLGAGGELPEIALPAVAAPVLAAPPLAEPALVPLVALGGGVPGLLTAVALLLAGLLAAGLRRLPDRLLALPTVECDERQS